MSWVIEKIKNSNDIFIKIAGLTKLLIDKIKKNTNFCNGIKI